MGWSVRVTDVTYFIAQCSEGNCGWSGPHRNQHWEADRDAEKHIRAHQLQYDEYQRKLEEWRPGDPIVTWDNCIGPSFGDEPNLSQRAICRVDHPDTGWGPHHS